MQWVSRCLLFTHFSGLIATRDQFLNRASGLMLPGRAVVSLNACEADCLATSLGSVCGLDMRSHLASVSKVAPTMASSSSPLTTSEVLLDLNLTTCECKELRAEGTFELKVTENGKLRAFQLIFEVMFNTTQLNASYSTLIIDTPQDDLVAGSSIIGTYALFHDAAIDPSGVYTLSLSWNQTHHQVFKVVEKQ